MDLKTLDDWRPCDPAYGPPPRCWTTWFGHRFHWIHTMRLAETPWGWRDGVVGAVEDGWITVDHLAKDGHARLWHHEDLGAPVGTPVRVHEQWMGAVRPLRDRQRVRRRGRRGGPDARAPRAVGPGAERGGVRQLDGARC